MSKEFKGIMALFLSQKPVEKSMKTNDGKIIKYWDLTLGDGNLTFNHVTGDSEFDFSKLEICKVYPFTVIPRVKTVNAIAQNGNQYLKAYNDFKIIGVASKEEFAKLIQ